jgi:hypothetical protein
VAGESRNPELNGWSRHTLEALGVLAVILVAATALALALGEEAPEAVDAHGHGGVGEPIGTPSRWTGPQGRTGQFVAKCAYSHSAPDDPIVHYQHPGRSHRHDFYGAEEANAFSTAEQLLESPTTCDKPADLAAYWQPTLYDHDEIVEPLELNAYYRAAPGVDPESVVPFPFGMELIAGDQTITTAEDMDEAAGWVCGSSTRLGTEPLDCPATAPLHMVLTFPDCWNGTDVSSDDFRSHAAYSDFGTCPDGYPVHLPQLTMSIKYPISGPDHDLRLASGNVHSAHGDFINSWDMDGLEREVRQCIHREAVCDLVSNRQEDGPFFAN